MMKENLSDNTGIGIDNQKRQVEPLPYQRWAKVLTTLYRQAVDKDQFIKAMKLGGLNINGVNITPIDFFLQLPSCQMRSFWRVSRLI